MIVFSSGRSSKKLLTRLWEFVPHIAFEPKGKEIRYRVKLDDYIYGTMFEGNKLKAYEKVYYKRRKEGFGYKLVHEKIDGVEV